MTQTEIISILGVAISFLVGIVSFLIKKNVSDIEAGISKVSDEVYKSKSKISDELNELKKDSLRVQVMLKENSVSINYIQKTTDDLKQDSGAINAISNRLVATETKLENIGKVIFSGKKKD